MAKSTFARELERALIKAVIGLGAGLLIWFVGMQVITHTFSNMQEEMLVNTHAAQERANAKLRERAIRLVSAVRGLDRPQAEALLESHGWDVRRSLE